MRGVWGCKKIVVDATGTGQPVASFLKEAVVSHVIPFGFTPSSKTLLGFSLQAAVNSGRLKMYAADCSEEYREFWWEMDNAQSQYRASQTLNFFVDPVKGHDDFLMSTALWSKPLISTPPEKLKEHWGNNQKFNTIAILYITNDCIIKLLTHTSRLVMKQIVYKSSAFAGQHCRR